MSTICVRLMALMLLVSFTVQAEVSVPSIFGSRMVLQRGQANPVWGWAAPGEKISVTFAGQKHTATAGKDGAWRVKLQPLKANAKGQTLTIQGSNKLELIDVLVGEVWVCSGQSNMAWSVDRSYDPDLESLTAKFPNIRLISVPPVGTQEPQKDFNGEWVAASPESVMSFSAVGFFFGRTLHQAIDVPVGLIDNAWGGSAAEAWIRRDLLDKLPTAAPYMATWKQTEANYDHEKTMATYETRLKKWQTAAAAARKAGKPAPQRPRNPRNPLTGQHRPGNLYNGVLKPFIGYGIKGAIWYQGESNSGRAKAYRDVFPLMIQNWRDEWGQGDFPFYWVQLADFREEQPEPMDDNWAELREAQTMTMDRLKNTGEAVIIDVGEGRDIHPRDKQTVAKRLARWALAKDYGVDIIHQSPRYKSMEIKGDKAVITFDHVGAGLYSFDVRDPKGFTLCGQDKKFVWANARIVGKDKVEVWAEGITPAQVRYAWAVNPVCTLMSREGLPATPFRTDDFKMVTEGQ